MLLEFFCPILPAVVRLYLTVMQDRELLSKFAQTQAQDAFSELVGRYMDAVYSAARRQVRDSQLAEDVAQAVFIILARKAQTLKGRESLAGWMMKTTHLASLDALKVESRRRRHERGAAFLNQSRMEQAMSSPIEEIAPELDRAMSRLGEGDRSAVTLRYLQGKTTSETAECLGISEPAAAKRIFRAVDRLRRILLRNRAIAPAVALAAVLDQIPRVSAPAALAASAVAAATTGSAAPAGLAIAKGVLHMMTFHKILAAMLLIAALASLTGVGVGTVMLFAEQPPDSQTTQPAPPTSTAKSPSALAGRLANGVSVEIIGINESPSAGKQWWLANGDPANTTPYVRADFPRISPANGCVVREIVVKESTVVKGASDPATVYWNLPTRASYGGGPRGNFEAELCEIYDDQPGGTTLHAPVAAGPWKTVCTDNETTHQYGESGLDFSFMFSAPYTVDGRTHLMAGWTGPSSNPPEDQRLLAIDNAGRQVVADCVEGAGEKSGNIAEFTVKLPRASIRQLQLQRRPFDQWIDIRNVSLHRGQKTDVKIVTSDEQPNP
jgi:RNA polymerase sigma factor (sigma-70 family)